VVFPNVGLSTRKQDMSRMKMRENPPTQISKIYFQIFKRIYKSKTINTFVICHNVLVDGTSNFANSQISGSNLVAQK
jgi:hypothetical protein